MSTKVTINGSIAFPGQFTCAADLAGRDLVVTIAAIAKENLTMQGGAKKEKIVMKFAGGHKPLVLNPTNADTIAGIYGTEASKWIGKRVTLYPTTTRFGKDTVPCIRVREVAPPNQRTEAPPAQDNGDFTPGAGPAPKGPTIAEQLKAAKIEAFKILKEQNPDADATTIKSIGTEIAAEWFPGRALESLGLNDWIAMNRRNWERQGGIIAPAGEGVPENEIGF